jgi:PKD repeat protein
MTIIFEDGTQVNAGVDAVICEGDSYTTSTATASNYSSLIWNTSGTGSFTNASILETTYMPSAADINSGIITLTLTAVGNSPCPEAIDAMTLTINGEPTAFAGTTTAICTGPNVLEGATATNYASLSWSTTGTGSFINGNSLTPIYTASALDLVNSPITFTLTAFPIAPCAGPSAEHTIIVNVFEGANIDAGANATICQGSNYTIADAFVDASVTSILWTTSGTGTFSDPTIVNPTYTPSAADIITGATTLTMTASNPACGDQSDYMVLTINSYPQVNAGADDFVCISGSYTVQDASIANGYTSFTWSVVTGNGTLLNPASLTPTYIPDLSDLGTQVTLMLTAEAAAPCTGAFSDVKLLTVTDNPVADAGSDATICETDTYTVNNAAPQNYSSLNWTTNGTGSFVNQGSINPTYVPSASDIAMGSVILTLEAANPPCLSDFDNMVLSFTYLPDVFAGFDATVDIGSSFQVTTATVANHSSFEWSTSGTGTFDDVSIINPVYTPSNQDFAWGSVQLTLTAEGVAPCDGQTATDYMILTVTNYPPVDFTWDISCAGNPVQFEIDETVTDIGAIVSYNWNFGDGTTSNLMEPQHTFAPAGTYIVSLTVVDTANYSNTVQHFVEVNALPVALFSYIQPSCHGEPTAFINNSSSTAGYITEWHWDFGDGNSTTISFPDNPNVTHTYLLSGMYTATLTVTSSTGCVAADVNTVVIQPSPVAAFEFSGNCADNPVQFTDLSQNNSGANIVSWSWNFGDPLSGQSNTSNLQNPTHQFTSAGVYDVVLIIENAMGCSSEVTEQVVVTDAPALSILVDEPGVCLGEAIQFTADVANAVSWLWNFGDGNTSTLPNPAHTYQFAGNYTVSVLIQDIDGCSASASLPITVYNLPMANFSNTNPGCDAGPVQFTDLSVSPNGDIVEWSWDFGDGSTSIEQNPEYTYATTGTFVVTLLVTDAVGCTDDFTRQISVDGSPLADFTFAAACEGQAVMFTDLSSPNGGADITFWEWNFGDPLSGASNTSTQQNPSHTFVGPMPAGGYTVTLTITNADGCSDTTVELVELSPAPPVAILVDDPVVCLGETILFNGEANNVVTWLWNFGDGNSASIQNPVHSYLVTGTFNVTLTIVTAQGCTNTATRQITVNAPPVAGFTTNSPVCFDSPVQFNNTSVSPNGNIQTWIWNFGDGTLETVVAPDNPNVEHTYAFAGTYNVTLTVIDNAGCEDDLTRQVIVENGPEANFTYEGSCFSNPFLFTDLSSPNGGPDLFSWDWDFGDPLSGTNNQSNLPNPSHVFTEPGTYTVTLAVTNTIGCSSTIALDVVVEALPDIDFTFEEEPFCPGEQIQFTSIGDNLTTWSWDFGEGGTSIIANPTYIYTEPGTYVVSLTATNTDGCQGTVSHTIVVEPAPNANFTSTSPSCEGAPIFFSNTSNSPTGFIEQWIWNFGDGSPEVVIDWPDNPDVEHTYALLGSYNASLTVVNSNGCSDTEVKEVQVIPGPVAAFDFIGTCAESPVSFIDLSQENGGGAIVAWHWDFGDPASGVDNESFLQNPTHSFTAPGDYTVTLTITNANGCESFADTVVTISEAIQVEIQVDNQTACFGEPFQFNGISDVAIYWLWDFGDGNTSTLQNPLHTYTEIGTYTVVLTAEDENGCSNTDEVEITVYPQPEANFISTAPSCSNNEVEFTDISISPNGLIVEWLWDFGDGNSSTQQNPVYSYEFAGSYEVTLLVTDIEGCSNETTQLIQISSEPLAQFVYEDDCASSPVLFTDLSSTNGGTDLQAWYWEFGDPQSGVNNTSTLQNPSHLFVGPMPVDGYLVTLIVTNTSGCTDTAVEPVLVGQLPEIAIEVSSDTLCAGEVVEFTGIGDDITSWFWNFGDGGVSTQQNPTYVYAQPGSYTVTLTATHLNGCEGIATRLIGVGQQPIANYEHANNCLGEITQFTDLSVSPGAIVTEWLWDFGDGNTSTEQNPTNEYTEPGDYFVSLTISTNYGCVESISRWVSIFDTPEAGFTFVQACEPPGQFFFFDQSTESGNGSPLVEYAWYYDGLLFSDGVNPRIVFPETGVNYSISLIITDAVGCTSQADTTITVWQPLDIGFTATEVCVGAPTLLEAFHEPVGVNIAYYTWNFNDGSLLYETTEAEVSHTFPAAGTYPVELTTVDENGCSQSTFSLVVVNPLPIPDFEYAAGVCDEPTRFTETSSGNGAPITDWFWDFGDGNTSAERNPEHIYNSHEGTYIVSLTVTNENGCINTIIKEVYKEPCLQASFILPFGSYCAQSEICFEENSIIIATDGQIIAYDWNFGDGDTLSYTAQQNPICHTYTPGFAGFEGGEFDVSLTITGEVGGSIFTHTFTETITIRPKPEARFIPAPVCQGTLTQFEDNSIGHGEPIVGWNWNFGDLTSIDDTSSMQNPAYEYPTHGFYDVELIVRNEYGCSDTLVQETEVWQRPVADFSYEINCATYQTLFFDESVEGGEAIIGWQWDFGMAGSTSFDQNTYNIYNEAAEYEVQLIVNDANQCYDTIIYAVDIFPIPTAQFSFEDEYQGRQGLVSFLNESIAGSAYFWNFDDGNFNDTDFNPVHQYTDDGTYEVMLIAYNEFNCPDTIVKEYTILFTGLYFPNTFVPQSTNPELNKFMGIGENLESYSVEVYTSWGQLVYSSTLLTLDGNPDPEDAWDGTFRGQDLPVGSYIWRATGVFKDGSIWKGADNGDGNLRTYGIINIIR